jgi:hypothetical protein
MTLNLSPEKTLRTLRDKATGLISSPPVALKTKEENLVEAQKIADAFTQTATDLGTHNPPQLTPFIGRLNTIASEISQEIHNAEDELKSPVLNQKITDQDFTGAVDDAVKLHDPGKKTAAFKEIKLKVLALISEQGDGSFPDAAKLNKAQLALEALNKYDPAIGTFETDFNEKTEAASAARITAEAGLQSAGLAFYNAGATARTLPASDAASFFTALIPDPPVPISDTTNLNQKLTEHITTKIWDPRGIPTGTKEGFKTELEGHAKTALSTRLKKLDIGNSLLREFQASYLTEPSSHFRSPKSDPSLQLTRDFLNSDAKFFNTNGTIKNLSKDQANTIAQTINAKLDLYHEAPENKKNLRRLPVTLKERTVQLMNYATLLDRIDSAFANVDTKISPKEALERAKETTSKDLPSKENPFLNNFKTAYLTKKPRSSDRSEENIALKAASDFLSRDPSFFKTDGSLDKLNSSDAKAIAKTIEDKVAMDSRLARKGQTKIGGTMPGTLTKTVAALRSYADSCGVADNPFVGHTFDDLFSAKDTPERALKEAKELAQKSGLGGQTTMTDIHAEINSPTLDRNEVLAIKATLESLPPGKKREATINALKVKAEELTSGSPTNEDLLASDEIALIFKAITPADPALVAFADGIFQKGFEAELAKSSFTGAAVSLSHITDPAKKAAGAQKLKGKAFEFIDQKTLDRAESIVRDLTNNTIDGALSAEIQDRIAQRSAITNIPTKISAIGDDLQDISQSAKGTTQYNTDLKAKAVEFTNGDESIYNQALLFLGSNALKNKNDLNECLKLAVILNKLSKGVEDQKGPVDIGNESRDLAHKCKEASSELRKAIGGCFTPPLTDCVHQALKAAIDNF